MQRGGISAPPPVDAGLGITDAEHTEIDAEDGIDDGAKQEDVAWLKHGSNIKRSHKLRKVKDTKGSESLKHVVSATQSVDSTSPDFRVPSNIRHDRATKHVQPWLRHSKRSKCLAEALLKYDKL